MTDVEPPAPSTASKMADNVAAWIARTLSQPVEPVVQPSSEAERKGGVAHLAPSADANRIGAWTAPQKWPLIGVHASLLPDGRVLTYGTSSNGDQTGKFIYDLWDSSSQHQDKGHITLPNITPTDFFCNAQTLLAGSGQLFLAGGDNNVNGQTTNTANNNTAIFNPRGNSLQSGGNLNRPRWYSTVSTLSDGQVFIIGGLDGQDFPEVRSKNGEFSLLRDAPTSQFHFWYPRTFLAPDDRVFGLDIDGRMFFVDPRDSGHIQRVANIHPDFMAHGSSAVMYAAGQILQVGGNSNRVAKISINYAVPTAAETSRMSSARYWGTATALPDGKVLVTGGSAKDNELVEVNNKAEIWDPATGQWTQGATGALARLYHSTALLLPDATVLVAGGGAPGPLINTNAERYSPPYLFSSNGQLAPRPQITSAPDTVAPGQMMSIGVDSGSDISKVVLIRTGSVTHSVNFDQRRVVLAHKQAGGAVSAQLPANGAIVPPGFYMLFVLDASGVPSVARIVQVNEGDRSAIRTDWTGTIGGRGGSDFKLECGGDEVLIGIYGRLKSELGSVGSICTRVDASGRWFGEPSIGSLAGTGDGEIYTSVCPANQGVVGFAGRSDDVARSLQLSCEPLSNSQRTSGNALALADLGSAAGLQRPYRRCGSDGVARGLYGRASAVLDKVGLLCRNEEKQDAFPFFTSTRTQVHGGTEGNAYALSCNSDEVLVGIGGRSGAWTDRLSPLCVKVDEQGRWNSDVVARGAAGGSGGSAFSSLCPSDQAVSAVTAETGSYVNRMTVRCQPTASTGKLVGSPTVLPATSGMSGAAGTAACPNGMPAHGLVGRAGPSFVNALGLECRGAAS